MRQSQHLLPSDKNSSYFAVLHDKTQNDPVALDLLPDVEPTDTPTRPTQASSFQPQTTATMSQRALARDMQTEFQARVRMAARTKTPPPLATNGPYQS